MIAPFAHQLEPFARLHLRQIAHHGNERLAPAGVAKGQHPPRIRLEPQNGVTIFLIVISDPLHGASDLYLF